MREITKDESGRVLWEDAKHWTLNDRFCRDGKVWLVVVDTWPFDGSLLHEVQVRQIPRIPGGYYEDGISVSW